MIQLGTPVAKSFSSNKGCRSLENSQAPGKRFKNRPSRLQNTGKIRCQRTIKANRHPTKQQGLQPEPDYCETVVEIELQNLRLDQLIDFLWKVEPSKVLVRVKSLYIRKNATNADLLDSVIQTRASGHDFVEPHLFLSKPNLLPANFCTS